MNKKYTALAIAFLLIAIAFLFVTHEDHRAKTHDIEDITKGDHQKITDAQAKRSASKNVASHSNVADSYVKIRKNILAASLKTGKSPSEVAADMITAAKANGSADSLGYDLMIAFWDDPQIFLEGVKSACQGNECQMIVESFLSRASEQRKSDYMEMAYHIFPPGQVRNSIARKLCMCLCYTKGADTAFEMITKLEMPEERKDAAHGLKAMVRAHQWDPTPEQARLLKEMITSK